MAQNDQGSQELGGDRQSSLLRLAERTVLQAETLAREITDNARQESEAEGAKLLAQYTDQAKAEAQQTIEVAQRRSETLLKEATGRAAAESEKILAKARSDNEKSLGKARAESENILSKAQSESEESLGKAQTEGREILGAAQIEVQAVLGRARQEALAVINASQARADSTESSARLQAEFLIRQTTQSVADGIRSAILETCNKLLPALEGFGKDAPEAPVADQVDHAVAIETAQDSSPPDPAGTDSSAQSSDRPSGRRARSSTTTSGSP